MKKPRLSCDASKSEEIPTLYVMPETSHQLARSVFSVPNSCRESTVHQALRSCLDGFDPQRPSTPASRVSTMTRCKLS